VQLYGAGSPNTNSVLSVWTNSYLYYRDDVRCVVLILHRLSAAACANFPFLLLTHNRDHTAGCLGEN
jgi:hypothetical protein